MKYSVKSFVHELLEEGVITSETGNRILDHYRSRSDAKDGSRILGIFGVLGALLVGIGLILIVAHNWDGLSRSTKSILSIAPVVIGVGACGYSLMSKPNSFSWKEGSAVFLTCAFGACIALISQIYNIPGSLKGYMLTWVLAILPLMYIMPSRITSLLYIVGVTAYGCMAGYDGDDFGWDRYGHWLLFGAAIPFYYTLITQHPRSNTTYFHHWIIPLSASILIGTLDIQGSTWLFPLFFGLFSCYYLWSSTSIFENLSLRSNGYRIIGSLGMIVLLLTFSFIDNWENMTGGKDSDIITDIGTNAFFVFIIVTGIAGYLLFQKRRNAKTNIMDYAFVVFPIIFLVSLSQPMISTILTNAFLLLMAVATIYKGSEENHLGIVNYGLLVITALIICRFFDVDIPFVIRGLLFIGVGAAFFLVNHRIIQRRKALNQ